MPKTKLLPTKNPKLKAILVGVNISNQNDHLSLEDSIEELERLADSAGVEVLGIVTQNLNRQNPKTFIGSGKVEEVKILAEELGSDLIIFDNELSPRHQRELEMAFGIS